MSNISRLSRRYVAVTVVLLAAALCMIIPRLNRANPLEQQILISEFSVQPSAKERVELYLVNMYGYDIRGCVIETDYGQWVLRPDLDFPDSAFVILSDSSVVGDLELSDTGGYIRIYDDNFEWAAVYYGNHAESFVPAPVATQSASAEIRIGEYNYHQVLYYYLDNSPTFGEWNDQEGAWGAIRGTVTDSSNGMPIAWAAIRTSVDNVTVSDSSGSYYLDVMSGFPTVTVSADGYRPDTSGIREITLLPDSTFTHDVELAPGSGIQTPDSGKQPAPRSFTLTQNYPNPFNPSTNIHFEISETGGRGERTSLVIFDTRGRRVRTLVDAERTAGRYTVQWDGKDENGLTMGSGVYFYRLQVGAFQSTRRMVVLK